MPPTGFETTISASERPQNRALDRAANGTGNDQDSSVGNYVYVFVMFNTRDLNFRKWPSFTKESVENI